MIVDLRYVEKVRGILIAAELRGITFQDLYSKVRTPNHDSVELRTLLNAWRRRKWVDHFRRYGQGGRPKEIWRATNLIEEQWPPMVQAIQALVYSTGLPLDQDASELRNADPDEADPSPVVAS